MKTPSPLFFNRELSWIEFNARVLHEARRTDIPLMERLKFLAIVSSNFDEFFMVRVAAIKRQRRHSPEQRDLAGLTPQEQLERISNRAHQVVGLQYETLMDQVLPQLAQQGIHYVSPKEYTQKHAQFTKTMFMQEIFPLLTPIRTDGELFPHLANLKLYGAFALEPLSRNDTERNPFAPAPNAIPVALIQVPAGISRIVVLPAETPEAAGSHAIQFTLLDDIIYHYATYLFPGYKVLEGMLFKVNRDADFAVDEDETIDLPQAMEAVLEKRQSSWPVRLLCTRATRYLTDFLQEKLGLTEQDVYTVEGPIDPSTLLDLTEWPQAAALSYEKWEHFYPPLLEKGQPLWDTLKHRDVLIHVPFESYDPVVTFLNDAADDANTMAIKMTLYRTSGNSPIIRALERAAQKGKQVTVFVELKARFDERQNLSWADQLEKAGVIVVHGILHLKVHGKLLMVVRREETGICRYVHLSTGNYNDKTAKLYVDLSLFTTNEEFANDATLFFNTISGYSIIQPMERLLMAPVTLKDKLLELIERETRLSTESVPGLIIAKMNSIGHEEIIQKLYEASQAGVRVLLNVRGICMLVPGVPGQSENIQVVSIIDRYLEHSRIFYFQNGGAEELYLSSADWMPRNMERRVELMFPVLQEETFKEVKRILQMYFEDTSHAHQLQRDGSWVPAQPTDGQPPVRVQEKLQQMYQRRVEACDTHVPIEFVVRRRDKKV
ncbi:MAG: polyphosphate kinase 1 [Spirochaetaceae bacterium]|nr:polyphosphate kinase 1 [Spirochaetaceae bacterium]